MDSLKKAKVNPKFYRVWFKMNQNTVIQVKTTTWVKCHLVAINPGGILHDYPAAGMSTQGLAGQVTGQGGGGTALASALNLDQGLDAYFRGSQDEECYGSVRLQPLVYMDDTARASNSMNAMRAGNVKLAALLMEKK